jgi:two-component system, cell cycle sensor histidine kinase and response regulator CckA
MEGRSVCILLVDDEETVLEVGVMMLERLGYQVLGARSSAEAVEVYRANKDGIDLVLLDLNLSGESGADTFKRIQEIDPNVKVVLSTGCSENQEILDIMNHGCRGMIQKPFGLRALAEKIGLALN